MTRALLTVAARRTARATPASETVEPIVAVTASESLAAASASVYSFSARRVEPSDGTTSR